MLFALSYLVVQLESSGPLGSGFLARGNEREHMAFGKELSLTSTGTLLSSDCKPTGILLLVYLQREPAHLC